MMDLHMGGFRATKMCAEGYSPYSEFLIKTTADWELPCEMTSLLSRDQSKENIS